MSRIARLSRPISPTLVTEMILGRTSYRSEAFIDIHKIVFKDFQSITRYQHMQSRVEVKARVANLRSFLINAKEITGRDGEVTCQNDTFFNCPNGKLKLRDFGKGVGQLIFYCRPGGIGPKVTQFQYADLKNTDKIKTLLDLAYGIKGKVTKVRTTFLIGQTRIHADDVNGLGTFMELEIQMKEGQSEEENRKILEDLMTRLGVSREDMMTGSYLDHVLKKQG